MHHSLSSRAALLTATALLTVGAALSACAAAPPHAPTLDELLGSWQLADAVPAGARTPTLTIGGDGSVNGNGGVNRFRGRLDTKALADDAWRMGPLAGTRMAGPAEAMALETSFLSALGSADRARVAGDRLLLQHGDRAVLALVRLRLR